jgi:hypothetical protein
MPLIQLLGEDADLLDSIAELSSQKGHTFSRSHGKQDLLRIIPHSLPSLIIIAPSRDNRWNVFKAVAEIRTGTPTSPLAIINNRSSEGQVMVALKSGVNN